MDFTVRRNIIKKRSQKEVNQNNSNFWKWAHKNFNPDGSKKDEYTEPAPEIKEYGVNSGSLRVDGSQCYVTHAGMKFLKRMAAYNKVMARGIPIDKRNWITPIDKIIQYGGKWRKYNYTCAMKSCPSFILGGRSIILAGGSLLSAKVQISNFTMCSTKLAAYIVDVIKNFGDFIIDDIPVYPFAYQRAAMGESYRGVIWFRAEGSDDRIALAEEYFDLINLYWPRKRDDNPLYAIQTQGNRVFYSRDRGIKNKSKYLTFSNHINMLCGSVQTIPEKGWPDLEVI